MNERFFRIFTFTEIRKIQHSRSKPDFFRVRKFVLNNDAQTNFDHQIDFRVDILLINR